MDIVLIGLGAEKGELSLNALSEIKGAEKVFVRSLVPESTKIFEEMKIPVESFDGLFEKTRGFDSLNKKIAAEVLKYAKNGGSDTADGKALGSVGGKENGKVGGKASGKACGTVAYCVDGAVSDDNAAAIILKRAKNVRVKEAASRAATLVASECFRGGYTAVSAYSAELITASCPTPLIVYDIDSEFAAAELKLKLCDLFGDEAPAVLSLGGKKIKIKMFELDRFSGYGYDTALLLTPQELTRKTRFSLEDLLEILRILRSENGCEWDRAQTRESIANNLIEECYELYDAILQGDVSAITEECGDVLLQAAFHILFGEEAHEYNRSDVISGICEKLITRHTHVFGTDNAANGELALALWEKNKQKEKGFGSASEYLQSVPKSFPGAMRAQKLQKRAAKYGFDFENVTQIYDKIAEESQEVKSAPTREEREKEVGDLLFSAVNLARYLGFDAEQALNASADKFLKRFTQTEKLAVADGKDLKKLSAKEWDNYYNECKKLENR